MYLQYFGLNKEPFKITPDPEFFFSGGNRGAVLEALIYATARGEGIVKVVGEVGSGKTMLCRMLERELPEACDIVYLANPRLSPDEILHAIAIELELDIEPTASKLEVMRVLHAYLLEKHANNRRVVMFIEEAQGIELETLEEVRMLSNLETTQDKLLQIVLFGQPELDEKLGAHEIRQLKERITYAFDLAPLNREEIRDYLNTRVRASGFRGNDLFSRSAIRALQKRSRGLLRRINILADKALLAAFSCGARTIDAKHVRMAAKDSEFSGPRSFAFDWRWLGAAAAVGALAIVAWLGSDYLSPVSQANASKPVVKQSNTMLDVADTLPKMSSISPKLEENSDAQRPTVRSDIDLSIAAKGQTANAAVPSAWVSELFDLDQLTPKSSNRLAPENLAALFE